MRMLVRIFAVVLVFLLLGLPARAGERVFNIQCDSTPPYIYWDESENRVTGLWAETVRAVMARLGERQEELRILPWARLLDMGLKGAVDGVFGAVRNPEREQRMWFPAEPLLEDPWVFWIRKEDAGRLAFASLEDLKGRRVGLVKDYAYTPELWAFVEQEQNHEVVVHDSLNLRKLAGGRLDYAAATLGFGTRLAREEGLDGRIMPLTGHPIVSSVFYVMFNKDRVSREWVDRFSEELAAFKATDEYRELLKKFGI